MFGSAARGDFPPVANGGPSPALRDRGRRGVTQPQRAGRAGRVGSALSPARRALRRTTLDSLFLMLQRPALRLRCRLGFSSACLLNTEQHWTTTLDSLFLMLQRPALRLRCRFGFSSACLLNHDIKYPHIEALFRLGQPTTLDSLFLMLRRSTLRTTLEPTTTLRQQHWTVCF